MSRKKDICERIKVMRMSRNMSQADLARALHCGQSTVAMYETGKRMPDLDTIDFLADIFNVPPYAILYSEQEVKEMISISQEERRLLAAYRAADQSFQKAAIQLLELNPAVKEKENRA